MIITYGNGNLTKDVEVITSQNDKKICNFSIAVRRDYKNAIGKYDADFFNCVAYGKTADVLKKYTRKGDLIGVHGTLQNSTYEKDGVTKTITKIVVEKVDLLSRHETVIKREQGARLEPTQETLPF